MWNGSNPPPHQHMGMYTSATAANTDSQSTSDQQQQQPQQQSLPLPPNRASSSGSRQSSSAMMIDDQLHMDAVSALTSLQGGASGFAPQQLVRTLSSSNAGATMPYAPTTTAVATSVVMTNPMLQRHYAEDYAAVHQSPYFGISNNPEDHIVSNGMFNHTYHPSMYGTSLNGGGGHHPALQHAVLPPQYAQHHLVVPTMNTVVPPAIPTGGMAPSRQGSSSMTTGVVVPSNSQELHQHAMGELSSSTSVYHPLHPNDRPNVATLATNSTKAISETSPPQIATSTGSKTNEKNPSSVSLPVEDYNEIYHPPHPSERPLVTAVKLEDNDDDDIEEDGEMNNDVMDAVVDKDDEEDTEEDDDTVGDEDDDDDDDDDGHVGSEVAAQIVLKVEPTPQPRGKPEAAARALAAAKLEDSNRKQIKLEENDDNDSPEGTDSPAKKSASRTTNPKKSPSKKSAAPNRKKSSISTNGTTSAVSSVLISNTSFATLAPKREFLLGEDAPVITEAEYNNLKEMMVQFCRVPLLSEFSRPVAMLHPEVTAVYSKIITHPVDLGHVCRGIRRHQYANCRDVRLDVWRVFANCVKYNAHPSNREAVPSFVSIALHLRDYFNNLWQEYLLPSDPPRKPKVLNNTKEDIAIYDVMKAAFTKRNDERKKRLENSGVLVLSKTFTTNASKLLLEFVENGGLVDKLDTDKIFDPDSGTNDKDVDQVIQRLGQYHAQLEEISESGSIEYTLDAFYKDLTKCYTEHVLQEEDNHAMQNRFRCRLDRFFWKQAVPLHEANSRGVTQSSIWGNLAATIWARESSKKPFWPALCLGILPPAEQREGWHQAVTERNESRLPEKLRSQLMVAKKRCEQAQKRQSLSYFLVEFLGTHEFIWVRETDIIENFDPNTDPNKTFAGKKSRSTSSVVGSKVYATAIQECVWASEEYENVLQDAFESTATEDDDDDDVNFSFQTLAQSDDELDQGDEYGYQNDNDNMDMSDVEESNYLISHDGVLDASLAGRKSSKKRSQVLKKQTGKKDKESVTSVGRDDSSKRKRSRSKAKDAQSSEETVNVSDDGRHVKNDMRDLERRRKKRLRDHEKSGKADTRKMMNKRRQTTPNDLNELDQRLVHDKKSRATAIVKAYLIRLAQQSDNKSLALSGVTTIPSALVDSNGILGMALAFRAASGGLCMPDDGKEQLAKWKPWVVVDTDRPKSTDERVRNLKTKITLVENEIGRLTIDTERRQRLALEYVSKRESSEEVVIADDVAARFNHCKKRKKATPSKGDNLSDGESPVGKIAAVSVPDPSFEVDTQEGDEDMTNYDTDDESEINDDVAVVDVDQSKLDVDKDKNDAAAVAAEYRSLEAMDTELNE